MPKLRSSSVERDPPAYLSPRRPSTSSRRSSIAEDPPAFLSPRRPVSVPNFETKQWSCQELNQMAQPSEATPTRSRSFRNPSLPRLAEEAGGQDAPPVPAIPATRSASKALPRSSSLRSMLGPRPALRQLESRLSEDQLGDMPNSEDPSNTTTPTASLMEGKDGSEDDDAKVWYTKGESRKPAHGMNDPAILSIATPFMEDHPSAHSVSTTMTPKPRPTLHTYTSLDNIMAYRDERQSWRRSTAALSLNGGYGSQTPRTRPSSQQNSEVEVPRELNDLDHQQNTKAVLTETGQAGPEAPTATKIPFRYPFAEPGFCFTLAITQFLAEYLISGFAVILPELADRYTGSMGLFWPASLLSLILSATLLIFARLSDMFGGYYSFQFGSIWLFIWTLIPGFWPGSTLLDVSRAMQGLALAAFMPAATAMMGSAYNEGPRKNFIMALYSSCAPLGFFAGFLVGGALPTDESRWYFWIASILAAITAVSAFVSVPRHRPDPQHAPLKMDYIGAFLITAGLILLSYGLSVVTYVNESNPSRTGWSYPAVYGPLTVGVTCLCVAFWYEGWRAACPLIPFDFFKPRSVKGFCVACLFFYGAFGIWLYNSAEFFHSPSATGRENGITGILLALWYTPTAIGGVIFCIIGGILMDKVPVVYTLLFSACAWVAAPLILALAPLPLNYWSSVLTSTLCATIGLDLTFTISLIFLTDVHGQRYQGFAGAVCSILINLAMSFALSISEIIFTAAQESVDIQPAEAEPVVHPAEFAPDVALKLNWGFKVTFMYAAASAFVGLVIVVVNVRIPSKGREARGQDHGEQELRASSESWASTLVNLRERAMV